MSGLNWAELEKRVREQLAGTDRIQHSLAVGRVMEALAQRLGASQQNWAIAGLVHDLDWADTIAAGKKAEHGQATAGLMAGLGLEKRLCDAIATHTRPAEGREATALYCADAARRLVDHPEQYERWESCDKLGIPRGEFVALAVGAVLGEQFGKPRYRKTVALLATMKEDSRRCPKKLIRPFGGATLFDIFAPKFRAMIESESFAAAAIIVPEDDRVLLSLASRANVPVIEQPKEEPGKRRNAKQIFAQIRDLDAEYMMWVNPCLPFLKPATVLAALQRFTEAEGARALTSVRREHNWFWDVETGAAINNTDPTCISTKKCTPLFRSTHAFHIFSRQQMLEAGIYWTYADEKDPMLVEVGQDIESVDIDTPLDFDVAEALYAAGCR